MQTTPLVFRHVEVAGAGLTDCRIEGGVVARLGQGLPRGQGAMEIDGNGGALIPGLADHHLHLAAMAAHEQSFDLSRQGSSLADALADQRDTSGWARLVGYDERAHGDLDRASLDALTGDVPTRVQHRSGALWVFNSAAIELLDVGSADHEGIERDSAGRPTGRLWRADQWLREALAHSGTDHREISLRPVGIRLASYGVTHVADATPGTGHVALVADAVARGDLPQRVLLLASQGSEIHHPRLAYGAVKIVVPDHDLPALENLADRIRAAHRHGRPVAVHAVTRAALALTLAASDVAGRIAGDRIEHAAVAGDELAAAISDRGLRVVTQPALVALRGDDYWTRSESHDRDDLWPYGRLIRHGVIVAPSSDAPYGSADPWFTIAAAASRRTRSGRIVGPQEAVDARTTLAGMLSSLLDPGGGPRRVAVGEPADLVLLDRPIARVLAEPHRDLVRITVIEGRIVHDGRLRITPS
jgi:predicted amidohydrolase YtcJ